MVTYNPDHLDPWTNPSAAWSACCVRVGDVYPSRV